VRSRGGAVPREAGDIPIPVKETLRHAEKVRIAEAAVSLIQDGETVLLDSGTTTAEIARQIRFRRFDSLTVITNALNVATELASVPSLRVIVVGGVLRHMSFSLSGPQAEQTLKGLHADRLFLGVDGLDPDIGLMTPDVLEAQLNARMIGISREVTVVADSSKFERRSVSVIARFDVVQSLITDVGTPQAILASLRARGVDVIAV
jgi:DeoR family transcriptional regulator of aga operon